MELFVKELIFFKASSLLVISLTAVMFMLKLMLRDKTYILITEKFSSDKDVVLGS